MKEKPVKGVRSNNEHHGQHKSYQIKCIIFQTPSDRQVNIYTITTVRISIFFRSSMPSALTSEGGDDSDLHSSATFPPHDLTQPATEKVYQTEEVPLQKADNAAKLL